MVNLLKNEAWFWRPLFMRRLAWRLALRGWFSEGGYWWSTGWPWWWPLAVVEYAPHTLEWRVFGISRPMPLGDALIHAEETFGCPITLEQAKDKQRREKPKWEPA